MSLQDRLMQVAHWGAEWVMWLLLGLSLAAAFVVAERILFFVSSGDNVSDLTNELRRLLRRGDITGARRMLDESPSFEARIAAACLSGSPSGADARAKGESQLSRLRMEQHLTFLGTLGNNAPFVGLLGTVIGIVGAFSELDRSGGEVTTALMSEVGEALVVTGLGLVVALPAVACFNVFQRIIQSRIDRGEALAQSVVAMLNDTMPTTAEGEA